MSPAAGALVLTLCDPSTPLHLAGDWDCPPVRDWVAFHCGAPVVPAEEAAFAVGSWEALLPLPRFRAGVPDYPDRSATLMVEVSRLEAEGARLSGPGIKGEARLSLPEPVAPLRENARRFPLGVDLFLCCGSRIAALPRSTGIA
jgi:alpha-D-ribose 1-methylphosphonate 5-triphosphate synthase subunit PhnH